jgi:hypothetical protein
LIGEIFVLVPWTILSKWVHTPSSASPIILASRNVSVTKPGRALRIVCVTLEGLCGMALLDHLRAPGSIRVVS